MIKFKNYLKKKYDVIINENIIDPINEVTVDSDVAVNFKVPKINREKYKKLNQKTNRMKTFKKVKYYSTDIRPEDRSFKNLPRYANKKPICRFQDWLGIKQDSEFSKNGATGGLATNGKWYGWSHRAVYGFKKGDVIKPGHIGNKYEYGKKIDKKYNSLYDKDPKKAEEYRKSLGNFKPYKIKNDADAKKHAMRFSREVS